MELLQQVTDIKGKVDKMYDALMGNSISKDGGLVKRIEVLEETDYEILEKIASIEKKSIKMEVYQKIMWSCIGGTVGIAFAYLVQTIK